MTSRWRALLRVEERTSAAAFLAGRLYPFYALAISLAVAAAIVRSSGTDPRDAGRVLMNGAVGSPAALATTASKVAPLLFAALGIGIAARAKLWNLGAPGQIYVGALGAGFVGAKIGPSVPSFIAVSACLLAGALAGAAWIIVPAWLRAKRGVSELITTLLLNFVALDTISVLVQGPFAAVGASYSQSPPIQQNAMLPTLYRGNPISIAIVLALIAAAIMVVVDARTNWGFEVRALGGGAEAARMNGIRSQRRTVQVLLLSAAGSGLAGAVIVQGVVHSVVPGLESGYGFTAIAVALLGYSVPLGIVAASLFFGVLLAGAPTMNFELGVSPSIVNVTQGLVITATISGYAWQARAGRRAARRDAGPQPRASGPDPVGAAAG